MDILDILRDQSKQWDRFPPADEDAIADLVAATGFELPEEYLACLRYSNGGEGELAIEPGWFQLWSAEEVIPLNEDYEIEQNAPGFFGFGSSGGGELLAFDTRGAKPFKVVMIPFIPMTADEAIIIARDFAAFVQAMGREYGSTGS